ncbi:unnamed protein product [Hyaloperonospora brassicae]|uniref:FYVE-type domain-containing protein n=1 Tax=Hyaloperonospora brassicae TaxID=162125 RepID=A0AAV0URX7_HYABA|nr:unnamed protein product [Hyaloperonospora brassicae]
MDSSVSKRHSSPFPPLHLSSTTAVELASLAQKLVVRNISAYESFLVERHNKVDALLWRLVSSKDELRAYVDRPRAAESPQSYKADTPVADLPVVMITGTIVGSLDDVMYGVACPTPDQMRIQASYVYDDVPRSCVLSALVPPTPETPFNSIGIKWMEVHVPLAVRPVVKHRDFVYMETTGIDRLRNGERVGYHIVHSIQFPGTPPLDTHIRGNTSISMLYRQRTKNVTDVYIKGYFNLAGGIMRTLLIRSATRVLLTVANSVHCSHKKKLTWALRGHYKDESLSSSSGSTDGSSSVPLDDRCCGGCGKKQSVFVQAASRTDRGAKMVQLKRHCKLCRRYMCVDCRRQHHLSFLLHDERLVQRLVTICRACETEALSENAAGVARDELRLNEFRRRWDSTDVLNRTAMSTQSVRSE